MTMNKKTVVVLGLSILISGCLNANKEKNYNFIKGLNEYQKNDKVSALENYKKAYEVNKNNVVLLNEIAYLYVDLGNYEKVENYYKKALEVKPNDENSLKNLNVDYLDLYLLHWRGSIPFEETIRCMEKLKKDGKIKNWGVSNMDIDDMQELLSIPNGKNCLVNQVLYHLASKGIEYSLKPLTDKNHITTMAYCPIAQEGRLKNQLLFSKSVQELSKKYSISPIQVLLTYMLQKENTISIPKASKLEHMKEIVACRDIHFEKEDILLLDSEYPKPTKKLSLDIE